MASAAGPQPGSNVRRRMTSSASLLLGAVAAAAPLALGIPRPATAASCEAKTPEVTINMPLQEPVVDNSLAQPALQQLSDQFVPGRHGGADVERGRTV